jgi:hypothetical protein
MAATMSATERQFAKKEPVVDSCAVKEGSRWQYDPWGGICVARWVNGELWMGRDNNINDNGSRIFKTEHGAGRKLCLLKESVKVKWDNSGSLLAFMPDETTISVQHGKLLYNFEKVGDAAGTEGIEEGSKWRYDPWGGVCTARWVNGELWMGRDTNIDDNGTRIFKTENGGGGESPPRQGD